MSLQLFLDLDFYCFCLGSFSISNTSAISIFPDVYIEPKEEEEDMNHKTKNGLNKSFDILKNYTNKLSKSVKNEEEEKPKEEEKVKLEDLSLI